MLKWTQKCKVKLAEMNSGIHGRLSENIIFKTFFFYKKMFQGPKGFITTNVWSTPAIWKSTTKWRFYIFLGLIPLYSYLLYLCIMYSTSIELYRVYIQLIRNREKEGVAIIHFLLGLMCVVFFGFGITLKNFYWMRRNNLAILAYNKFIAWPSGF